jgi:hypothetical protein
MLEHLHEGLGGAVKNRHLNRVNVDEYVVDSAGIDRREQMLCGGEQNALLHQARCIADTRNVMALRLDVKIVEICSAKNNASTSRGWREADVAIDTCVKAHTLSGSLTRNRGLKHDPLLRW